VSVSGSDVRAQLRLYKVKPGQMEALVVAWRDHAVPVRQLYGFRVLAAWRSKDDAEFGWLVAYEGDGSFEDAEKAYYASPERAAMAQDPAAHLDAATTSMVTPL